MPTCTASGSPEAAGSRTTLRPSSPTSESPPERKRSRTSSSTFMSRSSPSEGREKTHEDDRPQKNPQAVLLGLGDEARDDRRSADERAHDRRHGRPEQPGLPGGRGLPLQRRLHPQVLVQKVE